jgi:hypothetical protein
MHQWWLPVSSGVAQASALVLSLENLKRQLSIFKISIVVFKLNRTHD